MEDLEETSDNPQLLGLAFSVLGFCWDEVSLSSLSSASHVLGDL